MGTVREEMRQSCAEQEARVSAALDEVRRMVAQAQQEQQRQDDNVTHAVEQLNHRVEQWTSADHQTRQQMQHVLRIARDSLDDAGHEPGMLRGGSQPVAVRAEHQHGGWSYVPHGWP